MYIVALMVYHNIVRNKTSVGIGIEGTSLNEITTSGKQVSHQAR